ncbi:MAG TPA: head-tail connector protein [Alicycliphilus sp.]|nr:head-tail connector protein [Alicycliphilus sp.]
MLTLQDAKEHIRVDDYFEDVLIARLIDAAQAAVLDYLGTETLPEAAPVRAACLMLLGSLYENRETLSERPLHENRLFDRLLAPYRVY